jgi:hypothetical protein
MKNILKSNDLINTVIVETRATSTLETFREFMVTNKQFNKTTDCKYGFLWPFGWDFMGVYRQTKSRVKKVLQKSSLKRKQLNW